MSEEWQTLSLSKQRDIFLLLHSFMDGVRSVGVYFMEHWRALRGRGVLRRWIIDGTGRSALGPKWRLSPMQHG